VVSRRTPDLARAADRPVYVETLTEEHGMARAEEPVELGEKLRFYPFHAAPVPT